MKNFLRITWMALILGATLLVWIGPASAFCHIVNFSQSNYQTKEDAGSVDITINRTITGAGCTGTLEYSTSDDSAKAPSDYTATSGTREITNPMEASFTFKVPINNDDAPEGTESFKVTFRHTAGSGQGVATGSATVTIQDNDAAQSPPPPVATSPKASPSPSPTTSPSPSPSPQHEESPSPAEEESPTPGVVTTQAADEGDDGGLPTGVVIAVLAAIVAGGAGAGLLYLRRRGAGATPAE